MLARLMLVLAALALSACSQPSQEELAWRACEAVDAAQSAATGAYDDVRPSLMAFPDVKEIPAPRRPSDVVLVFEGTMSGVPYRCTYNSAVDSATTFEWISVTTPTPSPSATAASSVAPPSTTTVKAAQVDRVIDHIVSALLAGDTPAMVAAADELLAIPGLPAEVTGPAAETLKNPDVTSKEVGEAVGSLVPYGSRSYDAVIDLVTG